MLGMVTGAVLRGEIPNARIIPVTLNYEKVLEIDAIVTEQMGIPKKMESFSGAVTGGIRTLKQNFGSVKVCFGEEISIQRFRKTLVRYQVQSMAIYNSPFFLTSACLYLFALRPWIWPRSAGGGKSQRRFRPCQQSTGPPGFRSRPCVSCDQSYSQGARSLAYGCVSI